MESIYHGIVVVSVLDDTSHTERIKGKLSGSLGDYLVNVRGDEEIRSFFEKHNLSISNNPTDEKQEPFLLLGVVHEEGKNKVDEVIIAQCCIYETEEDRKKYWIHSENGRSLSGDRYKLVLDDLSALFNLQLEGNFEDHGYLQIEPSKKAIEKVLFYLKPKKTSKSGSETELSSDASASSVEDSSYRQRDENARRLFPERNASGEGCRTQYQVDYERIVSTKAFRRLVDKAQVFSSSKGDHYRTRMTHTLTVNQIARALAQALGLNIMLTEAIALAHDIGHTPFGHQGERTLDDILKGRALAHLGLYDPPASRCLKGRTLAYLKRYDSSEYKRKKPEPCDLYGGFKHNFQSVRTLCTLEEDHIFHRGINASAQVLEGALWHTKAPMREGAFCKKCDGYIKGCCYEQSFWILSKDKERNGIFWDYVFHRHNYHLGYDSKDMHSLTLEGQVVALADEIAQRSHDIDDALSSGMLQFDELMDLSQIRSISELHCALSDIGEHIHERQKEGALFVNLERLQKARASSVIVNYLVQSALRGTDRTGKGLEEDGNGYGIIAREKLVKLDKEGKNICDYLEQVVTSRVLNSSEVSRFDNKGRIIVEGLFEAYYRQPLMLPKNILRRMAVLERSNSYSAAIDLSNCNFDVALKEIESIQTASIFKVDEEDASGKRTEEGERARKKRLLVRGIVDYIAGMTDTFATQEYERIYGASL